ncbi:MAG: hypothetical protein J2P21_19430 [Chloracidobacterium sp.]|nr:hypothetical protein [Chloracidobacterium sp.]
MILNLKPAPDFHNPKVGSDRIAMKKTIEAAFGALNTGADFTTHDRCYKGENDFIRQVCLVISIQ